MKRIVRALVSNFIVLYIPFIHAREYLYPVAIRGGSNYAYLMHQISLMHLQLLQWDVQTKVITPVLPSSVTPAGIKMLPDNAGFSFIDQDSLYIKYFSKRSPIKIDITEPIHHMDIIEWIDSMTCYFSARTNDQFVIYQLTINNALDVILRLPYADCLYPQKIGSELYYIQRSFGKKNYSIKHTRYALHAGNVPHIDLIYSSSYQPIAFLHMVSSTHGFYISYPDSIESQASCLPCAYHQLMYDPLNSTWNTQKLFEFSIPLDFILPDSQDRLHESLLPLLPRHTEQGIYYCSCSPPEIQQKTSLRNLGGNWYDAEFVKIYFYDFLTQKTTLITNDCDRDAIAPLPTKNAVIYGISMTESSKNKELLAGMWRNEHGQVCYETPEVAIS